MREKASALAADADLLVSLIPGAVDPMRGRWRWDHRHRPLRGRVLVAPTAADVAACPHAGPSIYVAEPLDGGAQEIIAAQTALVALPRIVPDSFFPPGQGAPVFAVTRRFHLEERPRLVVLPPYNHGPRLTRLVQMARRLSARGGEMVLVDAIALRESLAPAVSRFGLAEYLVFLPQMDPGDLSGVLVGADLILVPDGERLPRTLASWAMATGIPVVSEHRAPAASVFGAGALWVYGDSADDWVAAADRALDDEPIREELARRALSLTESWRAAISVPIWQAAVLRP